MRDTRFSLERGFKIRPKECPLGRDRCGDITWISKEIDDYGERHIQVDRICIHFTGIRGYEVSNSMGHIVCSCPNSMGFINED